MKKLLSILILSAAITLSFCLPVYASYIIPNGSITTAKIADVAVTTAKITDQAVTPSKLANRTSGSTVPLGGVAVGGSFSFTSGSGPYVNVPGTGLTITTKGNPVIVGLVPDGVSSGSVAATGNTVLQFLRNSSAIGNSFMGAGTIPPAAFTVIDFPGAGTQVYGLQVSTAASMTFSNCRIFAYEL